MQLCRLENCSLKKAVSVKEQNGVKVDSYVFIKNYKIETEELYNEIDASIYGADINSILRISSVFYELERLLKTKVGNIEDNISKYFIFINNRQYKIRSVRKNHIDIQETGLNE